MTARHDINANQGETLNLHILYTDSNDDGIDLSSYTAEMKVKRTFLGDSSLLYLSQGGGITAGLTGSTGGITGGIFLNIDATGGSQTGGIRIVAGSTATSYIPVGRHHYDLEIKYPPTGETTRIVGGRFECGGEVTR